MDRSSGCQRVQWKGVGVRGCNGKEWVSEGAMERSGCQRVQWKGVGVRGCNGKEWASEGAMERSGCVERVGVSEGAMGRSGCVRECSVKERWVVSGCSAWKEGTSGV